MPVKRGRDKQGSFYQWGTGWKKYYYTPFDVRSREQAKKRAVSQGLAVRIARGF